jgi:hypothetical protein
VSPEIGRPLLFRQGTEVVKSLHSGEVELSEKLSILQGTFQLVNNKINQYSYEDHQWTTLEFMDLVGQISIYVNQLEKIFATVYRAASERKEGTSIPPDALLNWEAFRLEFNNALQEWKTLTDRATRLLGYGFECQAKPAASLR